MLNLFTKTKPWMLASLFVATSVFGQNNNSRCPPPCPPKPCPQPCPQPCPPTQVCPGDPCCPAWPTPVLNAAYNYPARIQTRCPWDFFADVSFIYWQPIQENLEVGFVNTTPLATNGLPTSFSGNYVNMDFDFKPGFQVGIGGYFDHDNWDLRLGYTWFHNTHKQSVTASDGEQVWPVQGHPVLESRAYNSASQKWKLKMDILQLDLGRWHYVGTKLVMHPYVGARAVWIRQNLKTEYVSDGTLPATTENIATITPKTRSWALGPEIGLDANWNLGSGFRFYGNAEGDILFTKYTKSNFSEEHTATVSESPFKTKQSRINVLRTHLDVELGFGWGTYLDCNNWYLDFAAGYGFQVFFDQNMFRHFNDNVMRLNSTMPYGNLYVHGLTLRAKLDF